MVSVRNATDSDDMAGTHGHQTNERKIMANWTGSARSNYFRVKDEQAFREALSALDITVSTNDERKVCLLSQDEYGGWPNWITAETIDEEDVEVDVAEIVAGHLAAGEVAILIEVGAEKLRYLTGIAVAVNDRNEQRCIDLEDIYEVAKELGDNVTVAKY